MNLERMNPEDFSIRGLPDEYHDFVGYVLGALYDQGQHIQRLENQMSNLSQAEADLAAAVQATTTELSTLEGQVTTLTAAVAAGDPAAVTAAATAIEAQVSNLKTALAAIPVPPAPASGTTAPSA